MSKEHFYFIRTIGIATFAMAGICFVSGCKKTSTEIDNTNTATVEETQQQGDNQAVANANDTDQNQANENTAVIENKKLKIFMPGAYMSDELIPTFKKMYNAEVVVSNFDSNEMMYAKIQSGSKYDLIIPSDYMIERMLKQHLLQPINKAEMTNIGELSDAVKNLSFDPDNTYSIPYFWGNVGIVYNKTKVPAEEVQKEGWSIFQNTKYAGRIYWYDSQRDSFMVALKALGYSMDTSNEDEINQAYEWLLKMNDTMKPSYVTDQVIDDMGAGIKDIAIVYSGDAATILNENEDMAFWAPTEGTNVWYDAMVIPTYAENPQLANKFINYAISYKAALGNTEAVGYTSPNARAYEEMTREGGTYESNDAYKPRTGYPKDELFHDNEVLRKKTSELWIKVKAHK